jgi:putative transposase
VATAKTERTLLKRFLADILRGMPNYRRLFIPGGTYFFTVVTYKRRPFLTDTLARDCLHLAIETIRTDWSFAMPAIVLLPDHLHAIWTLPEGDSNYPIRWSLIKRKFTQLYIQAGGKEFFRSGSRRKRKERGIWQRRYWEHAIDDEKDLERHFDYIHYNPVKHGLVSSPSDWPWSSFQRYVREGFYSVNWGSGPMVFNDLDETAME